MKNYFLYDTQPVNLKILPEKELEEALLSNEADVVIADDRCLQPQDSLGLKHIPILSEQLLLLVPKDHELADQRRVNLADLQKYSIMQLNTNIWLQKIIDLNSVELDLSWSVDSETWNYYWNSYSGDIPICFDTSASFVTHEALQARQKKCSILKVEGEYTNRMLYLWYFDKNEKMLETFLHCVKLAFR